MHDLSPLGKGNSCLIKLLGGLNYEIIRRYNNSPPYVMARWPPQQIPPLNFLGWVPHVTSQVAKIVSFSHRSIYKFHNTDWMTENIHSKRTQVVKRFVTFTLCSSKHIFSTIFSSSNSRQSFHFPLPMLSHVVQQME